MELRVHLKICEGCGCLWYRGQLEARVYCSACHERFKEFPTAQSRKRRGRPRKLVLPTVLAADITPKPASATARAASGAEQQASNGTTQASTYHRGPYQRHPYSGNQQASVRREGSGRQQVSAQEERSVGKDQGLMTLPIHKTRAAVSNAAVSNGGAL